MTQCKANTKKGNQCRRDAMAESDYCSTHQSAAQDDPGGDPSGFELALDELSDTTRAILGFATIGTIVYFALKFGNPGRNIFHGPLAQHFFSDRAPERTIDLLKLVKFVEGPTHPGKFLASRAKMKEPLCPLPPGGNCRFPFPGQLGRILAVLQAGNRNGRLGNPGAQHSLETGTFLGLFHHGLLVFATIYGQGQDAFLAI